MPSLPPPGGTTKAPLARTIALRPPAAASTRAPPQPAPAHFWRPLDGLQAAPLVRALRALRAVRRLLSQAAACATAPGTAPLLPHPHGATRCHCVRGRSMNDGRRRGTSRTTSAGCGRWRRSTGTRSDVTAPTTSRCGPPAQMGRRRRPHCGRRRGGNSARAGGRGGASCCHPPAQAADGIASAPRSAVRGVRGAGLRPQRRIGRPHSRKWSCWGCAHRPGVRGAAGADIGPRPNRCAALRPSRSLRATVRARCTTRTTLSPPTVARARAGAAARARRGARARWRYPSPIPSLPPPGTFWWRGCSNRAVRRVAPAPAGPADGPVGKRGRRQFLVKWEGYGLADATWEPAAELPPQMVEVRPRRRPRSAAWLDSGGRRLIMLAQATH